MSIPSSRSPTDTVSDILRQLYATLNGGGDVTVGFVLHLFGVRGFIFFLFVLALMNIVIFMVPGLSLLFGLPMVILAVQMVLGLKTPIFPTFIRQRMISRAVLARGLELGLKGMTKVEPLIRPRLVWVSGPHMDRVHSVLALLLAVLVAFPIPILNLPPSFGVVILALGLLQRDGLFVIASYVLAGWSLWLYGSLGQMAQRLVN